MELESKRIFLNVLDELVGIAEKSEMSAGKIKKIVDAVTNMPLFVPVVGEFSSGKSSLLNKFIGKNILPVGMEAKTSVPTELYYSPEEYEEGVYEDGRVERLQTISDENNKFVCIRRYINSEALKNVQPIVFVDMPGFDSGFDQHNKAIFTYLDKGCHYVVLVAAKNGTISRSMLTQVNNIHSFGKKCTFFVSKTDQVSEEEMMQIKTEALNFKGIAGNEEEVLEINHEDISSFSDFAKSLNPEKLFRNCFLQAVTDSCYDVKTSLNTKISAMKLDKAKNIHAIEELKNSLQRIESKKNRMIEDAKKNASFKENEADVIANAVASALNANLENLTDLAVSGGQEAFQEEVNSIVQNTVAAKINAVMEQISLRFSGEFSKEIGDLSDILCMYNADGVMDKLRESAKSIYDSGTASISRFLEGKQAAAKSKIAKDALTVTAGVFSAVTTILPPIVEVCLILLPTIIDWVKSNQRRENVRNSIAGQIPVIKRSVREKVGNILSENSEKMISEISEKYDEEIRRKAEDIEQITAKSDNSEEISRTIEEYERYVVRTDELLAQIL
ncbi:dynamin family protein [bacterium]|nr:dynamin family protein [bacterium]